MHSPVTTPTDSQKDASGDLEWLAFLYVTGEMASEEVSDFEARMAQEPAVCEAVARAVLLCQSLVMTPAVMAELTVKQPQRQSRLRTQKQPVVWSARAALVAACLLLALGLNLGQQSPSESFLAAKSVVELYVDQVAYDDLLNLNPDDADETAEDGEQVPQWLLLAVSEQHKNAEDGMLEAMPE